jgi:hypothetical protein
VAELTKYIAGLSYLNELDQEFDDPDPPEVRVGNARAALRALLQDGSIRMRPEPQEQRYNVDAVLLPLALLPRETAYDNRSCAGRI